MYLNRITDNSFTENPAGKEKPPKITLFINRTSYINAAETIVQCVADIAMSLYDMTQ